MKKEEWWWIIQGKGSETSTIMPLVNGRHEGPQQVRVYILKSDVILLGVLLPDRRWSLSPAHQHSLRCLPNSTCVCEIMEIRRDPSTLPLPSVRPHQLLLHVGAQVCLVVSDGWSARRAISMGKIHSSSAPWHITYGLVSFNRSINALPFSSSKYRPRACTFYLQVGRDCPIK